MACVAAAPQDVAPAGHGFPALTGRVVDIADLLPPGDEQRLTRRLEDVERSSKHQFVVVTVDSLRGQSIEDYGRALGNSWGIGRKDVNDGVLLVVAPAEHKVRIEVGYGLEEALGDEEAGEIIRTAILPHFRTGDMRTGILQGSEAIIREITS